MVEHLDAALARVWLLNEDDNVLELQASAGLYTHIDGPHGRIPVGSFKIGMIAQERRPHLTNSVIGDPRVHDQEWAKREKLVAFAGYPLLFGDRLMGVVAVFSRTQLSPLVLQALSSVADRIGCVIDRMRADEALQRSEGRFRAMIEHSSDAIVLLDAEATILYASASTKRVLGYEPEALLGTNGFALVHPDDFDAARRVLTEVIRQPGSTLSVELRLRHKDGRWLWNECVTSNCLDNPHVRAVTVNYRDITERRLIEESVREKEKLASLGLLAGGVAHDFNNLLTGIIGNAALALPQLVAPACQKHLREILDAAQKAADLTSQMLAYAGKGCFVLRHVDVSELIRAIQPLLRESIPPTVRIQLDLAPGLPAVEADAAQLQQLFSNIIINAAEAIGTSQPGTVFVRTEKRDVDAADIQREKDLTPGTYVETEIRDTGCGMDEATMAKIFDPFFTTKFQGRGLGLAAVSGIVRSYRGAKRVTSTPGRGSSFQILLPAA
jgi:PAS domain S-box-containing protein